MHHALCWLRLLLSLLPRAWRALRRVLCREHAVREAVQAERAAIARQLLAWAEIHRSSGWRARELKGEALSDAADWIEKRGAHPSQ